MADFIIPEEELDREPTGNRPFPEGLYKMEIEQCDVETLRPGDDKGWLVPYKEKGVQYDVAEHLSIRWFNGTPMLEEGEDCGEQRFFDDRLYLSITHNSETFYWNRPEAGEPWQMEATRKRLTKLARALRMVERSDGGVSPTEIFIDEVNSGELRGSAVLDVYHHQDKDYMKNGEKVTPPAKARVGKYDSV